jgi:hypothetical protein
MAGNSCVHIVAQERDRLLLEELAVARVVDREQAKAFAGFHSTTRANARLLALSRAGLLRRLFMGTRNGGTKALYTHTPKGAALAGVPYRGIERAADSVLVGDLFVSHQLSLNSIMIAVKCRPIPVPDVSFLRWRAFPNPIIPSVPLIPDGYFELETPVGIRAMFCEVDLGTESLKVWNKKVELYMRLATSGEFTRRFKHPQFRVLVVACSERRLQSLRRTVLRHTDKVFWFSSFDAIERLGFWLPVWLRPKGEERVSLY